MAPPMKDLPRWLEENPEFAVAPDWTDIVKQSVSTNSACLSRRAAKRNFSCIFPYFVLAINYSVITYCPILVHHHILCQYIINPKWVH